jgi:hypothetical protein
MQIRADSDDAAIFGLRAFPEPLVFGGASGSPKGEAEPRQSFWATLKTECFGSLIPKSRQHATLMMFDNIESF